MKIKIDITEQCARDLARALGSQHNYAATFRTEDFYWKLIKILDEIRCDENDQTMLTKEDIWET